MEKAVISSNKGKFSWYLFLSMALNLLTGVALFLCMVHIDHIRKNSIEIKQITRNGEEFCISVGMNPALVQAEGPANFVSSEEYTNGQSVQISDKDGKGYRNFEFCSIPAILHYVKQDEAAPNRIPATGLHVWFKDGRIYPEPPID